MFQYVPPFPQWQQGCSGQSPAFAMLPGSKGCSKLHGRGKAKTSVPISQKEKLKHKEGVDCMRNVDSETQGSIFRTLQPSRLPL